MYSFINSFMNELPDSYIYNIYTYTYVYIYIRYKHHPGLRALPGPGFPHAAVPPTAWCIDRTQRCYQALQQNAPALDAALGQHFTRHSCSICRSSQFNAQDKDAGG